MPKNAANAAGIYEVLREGDQTVDQSILFPSDQPAATFTSALTLTTLDGVPTSAVPLVGTLAYDAVGAAVYCHQGAGVWAKLLDSVGDIPTLAEVLGAGNASGPRNIAMDAGQAISWGGGVSLPSSDATGNMSCGNNVGATLTTGTGNVLWGNNTDVTIGTSNNAVILGTNATGRTNCTVAGVGADGVQDSSTALGANTNCYGSTLGTALGANAASGGQGAVAAAYLAAATGSSSAAYGRQSLASGSSSLALGHLSSATAANSVALGPSCSNSVANTVLMAPSSSVRIDSTLRVRDTIIRNVPVSLNISDSDFTLTAAQMLSNFVEVSGLTANRAVTLPTYASLSAAVPNLAEHDSWDFYLVNADSTFNLTLTTNTGVTIQPSGATTRIVGPDRIMHIWVHFSASAYQVRIVSIESS